MNVLPLDVRTTHKYKKISYKDDDLSPRLEALWGRTTWEDIKQN